MRVWILKTASIADLYSCSRKWFTSATTQHRNSIDIDFTPSAFEFCCVKFWCVWVKTFVRPIVSYLLTFRWHSVLLLRNAIIISFVQQRPCYVNAMYIQSDCHIKIVGPSLDLWYSYINSDSLYVFCSLRQNLYLHIYNTSFIHSWVRLTKCYYLL